MDVWSRWFASTCDGVGARVSWDGPSDCGPCASDGFSLDQEASDGLHLGAPGQCERSVLHIRDTHAPRRTYICIEEERKQTSNREVENNWS